MDRPLCPLDYHDSPAVLAVFVVAVFVVVFGIVAVFFAVVYVFVDDDAVVDWDDKPTESTPETTTTRNPTSMHHKTTHPTNSPLIGHDRQTTERNHSDCQTVV